MTNPVIEEARRLAWTRKVRPDRVGNILRGILRKGERRTVLETPWGLKFYLDPMSNVGSSFLVEGDYEKETREIFQSHLRPGDVFVDIGANEGIFSCLGAQLVGPAGQVVAIEPQMRLKDVLEINFALNGVENARLVNKALSDEASVTLHLWPSSNTGASSVVRRYRWGGETAQVAATVSFPALMEECAVEKADFVKIDVEGYEKEVIESMLPAIRQGRVGKILLDYHVSVLRARGIDAAAIERQIETAGMRRVLPEISRGFSDYVLYAAG